MPVGGRKPKPPGQAQHRGQPTYDWTEVLDVPFTRGPKLPTRMPNGEPWPSWTRRWWRVVASMPHCVIWVDSDWEYAYDTALLKAGFHTSGGVGLATEIRNRERVLGTTADYRRDLRVRYVDTPTEGLEADGGDNVHSIDDYREL